MRRHRSPISPTLALVLGIALVGTAACSSESASAPPPSVVASSTPDTEPTAPVEPTDASESSETSESSEATAPDEPTEPSETTEATEQTETDETAMDETAADDRWAEAAAATEALFATVDPAGPGCTVAVAVRGEEVFQGAWGAADIESGEPMSTDTVVDIGSTSKQFTATAILLLAERGELDVDDVVSAYVDGLPEWADEVTLRQMVHHVSGIPDYIELLLEGGIGFQDDAGDDEAMAALAEATELRFAPGEQYEYSNSNYFLLGEVVQQVTGDELGAFLTAEVFEPLGLDAVMDPVADIPEKAISYTLDGSDWVVADSPWSQTGDGGIQTTPTQLVRWASQYWAPTIGDDPDTLAATRVDDAVDADGAGYGWGMGVVDVPGLGTVYSHSGGWAGFGTVFTVLPDDELAIAGTCTAYELEVAQSDVESSLVAIWHGAA